MSYALDLGAAPKEGLVVEWAGQAFRVDRVVSFTSRGARYAELTWSTVCAECGAPVAFKTGLRHKWFAKRCKRCDPTGELDKAERKLHVKNAWGERMRAAKEAKKVLASGGTYVSKARIEGATLNRVGAMNFFFVWPSGRKVECGW